MIPSLIAFGIITEDEADRIIWEFIDLFEEVGEAK